MLSIGEFARLVGVSVRMLRHYDRLGLLVPAHVDPSSGYRSYAADQLDRANRLVALKDLGFSLEEVGRLLDAPDGSVEIAELLRQRRRDLREQIAVDEQRLAQVEASLRLIERKSTMSTITITETELPAVQVAQLSTTVTEMSEAGPSVGPLFQQLTAALADAGAAQAGPGLATYTGGEDDESLVVTAAAPVAGPVPDGVEEGDLPSAPRALTARYAGDDLAGLPEVWQAITEEAARRSLTPAGTNREVYLATPFDPDADGGGWLIEVQIPVA